MEMVEELDALWNLKVVGVLHTQYEHIEGYIDDVTEKMFLVQTQTEPVWVPRSQLMLAGEF
ncbi:hypothetical protein CN918_26045 [Priestia megaterium]|nr:hypothetical protein CN918_26045 [Priestia megaterium]